MIEHHADKGYFYIPQTTEIHLNSSPPMVFDKTRQKAKVVLTFEEQTSIIV